MPFSGVTWFNADPTACKVILLDSPLTTPPMFLSQRIHSGCHFITFFTAKTSRACYTVYLVVFACACATLQLRLLSSSSTHSLNTFLITTVSLCHKEWSPADLLLSAASSHLKKLQHWKCIL